MRLPPQRHGAGLQTGMPIVAVDGKKVTTARPAEVLAAGSVKAGIAVEARTPRGAVQSYTLQEE